MYESCDEECGLAIFKCRIRLCAETVQQITKIGKFLRKETHIPVTVNCEA